MGRDVLLLYMSPKNPKYTTQTNEGAVRYLIKEKETPDCILALCSETVRKEARWRCRTAAPAPRWNIFGMRCAGWTSRQSGWW